MGETEREAVIGELIHDAGSDPMAGWFILGVDGYFDVDNAVWCEFQDGDAPWTSEFFELHGTVPSLAARRESLAERVKALADRQQRAGDRLIEKYQERRSPNAERRWTEGYALRRSAAALRALLDPSESR